MSVDDGHSMVGCPVFDEPVLLGVITLVWHVVHECACARQLQCPHAGDGIKYQTETFMPPVRSTAHGVNTVMVPGDQVHLAARFLPDCPQEG